MLLPGLVSVSFRSLTPGQVVDLVVRADLKGIEWGGDIHVPHGDTDKADLARKLTVDAGLEVASYGSYYRAGVSEKQGLSFSAVLESAIRLHAPVIRVWAGDEGSSTADMETVATVYDDLCRITEVAAKENITVATEYHTHTLTDTRSSTQHMVKACAQSGLRTYWQPPGDLDVAASLESLRQIMPHIQNVHVHHWTTKEAGRQRCALREGRNIWEQYLRVIRTADHDPWIMLEFVKGDSPQQLLSDAQTLIALCA